MNSIIVFTKASNVLLEVFVITSVFKVYVQANLLSICNSPYILATNVSPNDHLSSLKPQNHLMAHERCYSLLSLKESISRPKFYLQKNEFQEVNGLPIHINLSNSMDCC